MKELIERLEKATGPDNKLDGDIAAAVVIPFMEGKWRRGQIAAGAMSSWWREDNDTYERWDAPLYTDSLDAARSLLPWDQHPGAELHVRTVQSGVGQYFSFVEFTWPSTERQGRSTSEPIATCICALLAREETERQLAPYRTSKRLTTG